MDDLLMCITYFTDTAHAHDQLQHIMQVLANMIKKKENFDDLLMFITYFTDTAHPQDQVHHTMQVLAIIMKE